MILLVRHAARHGHVMLVRRLLVPVSVIALGVACGAPSSSSDGPIGSSSARIVYGTADTANPHTAVVALLAPDSGGYDECSGTIIQVKGGLAYVLTAAHCCNQTQPSIAVMSNDYNSSVQYISSSSPAAPAYAVIQSSVQYDPNYNGNAAAPIDDFCMLQFNAPAGTPSIPVAVGTDGLAVGSKVDYVGFGVTSDTNQNNTARNIATDVPVNTAVTANTFSYTEGGGVGGPCEGDSGGPALTPPGVPQAQQTVVGTTSYGSQKCQPAGSTGVDMRVISETGPGGFISTYLGGTGTSDAGTGTGTDAGSSSGAPTTCAEADTTVGCCVGNTNYYCGTGSTTVTSKACTGGKVCGWSATKMYYECVTAPAEADPSGTYPLACGGGTTTTPDAGTGTGTDSGSSSTDATTGGDTGTSSSGDGGVGTADGAAHTDGATGTGLPDTGTFSADTGSGVVIVGTDSGSPFTTADGGTSTGSGSEDGGAGSSTGNSGGCSTSGHGAGAPPWFAIGLALLGLRSRRRAASA